MVLVLCRIAVFATLAWVVIAVPVASAGPLDTCAQRVIRDWYSGGRVNDVYPLACYRAAIRALPNDVLEYSEADKDIARALAFARRGRTEQGGSTRGNGQAAPAPAPTPPPAATEPVESSVSPQAGTEPVPPIERPVDEPPIERPVDEPSRLASGPEPTDVSAAVPYPVIVLAALAGTLLATGAVGWALARRR